MRNEESWGCLLEREKKEMTHLLSSYCMQLQYQSLNMFHLIDLQEPHTLWVHYYLHFMEIRAS